MFEPTHRCYDWPGAVIEAQSRPCVVVTPAPDRPLGKALVRYTDGDRERVLADPAQLEPLEVTT